MQLALAVAILTMLGVGEVSRHSLLAREAFKDAKVQINFTWHRTGGSNELFRGANCSTPMLLARIRSCSI